MNMKRVKNNSGRIVITSQTQRVLLFVSCLYLVLPYFIYYIGNQRLPFAVLFSLGAAAWLVYVWRTGRIADFQTESISRKSLFLTLAAVLLLLLACGTGGLIGKQAGDWNRTNAILSDMVNKPWPVSYFYEETQSYVFLNYYMAYLMPAAAVGRILHSLRVADAMMGIWLTAGVFLGIFWIMKALHCFRFRLTVAFFFWGGLDFVGNIILNPRTAFLFEENLDHWADIDHGIQTHIANYHMMATAFRWSVQHYIPTIIVLFLMLVLIKEVKDKRLLAGLLLTLCFWSPMALLGFLPFAVLLFWIERKEWKGFFGFGTWAALAGFALPMLPYYLSLVNAPDGVGKFVIRGFTWLQRYWWVLLLFVTLEYGIAAFLTAVSGILREKLDRLFFAVAVISLTLILFVDYGMGHDLSMRFAIAPLLLLFYYAFQAAGTGREPYRTGIILYMVLAGISGQIEYSWCVQGLIYNPVFCTQALLANNTIDGWELEYQYVGRADSFYHRNITRPVPENEFIRALKDEILLYDEKGLKILYGKNQLWFCFEESRGTAEIEILSDDNKILDAYELNGREGIPYSGREKQGTAFKKSITDWDSCYVRVRYTDETSLLELEKAGKAISYPIYDYSDAGWYRGLARNENILLSLQGDISIKSLEGKKAIVEDQGRTWVIKVARVEYRDGFVQIHFEGELGKIKGNTTVRMESGEEND